MRRFVCRGALMLALGLGFMGATDAALAAAATPGWECIPTTAGKPVVSGGTAAKPSCASGHTAALAPSYIGKGVDGKATVQLSAVNLQVVDGAGETDEVNGTGNVVIGYDEKTTSDTQSGSHDLILGEDNSWGSYGTLIGGFANTSNTPFAATFGKNNTASGEYSIVAGNGNTASGEWSSAIGGTANTASGNESSVAGGIGNDAQAFFASIPGGKQNIAAGTASSIAGGFANRSNDDYGSILGGCNNQTGSFGALNGTCDFEADANTVAGGVNNLANGEYGAIAGGDTDFVQGDKGSFAAGGFDNTSQGTSSSQIGGDERLIGGTDGEQIGGTGFNP